ncbi:MAG: HD domain-containing protein [Oscillospiraceae bacterium]|nr:HD domain-containing protein [Oscillospiraceae bacterium]
MGNQIINFANLVKAMIDHETGCEQRIGHFLKVYGYAKTIGELENLDQSTQYILEIAALMHDVGIKTSLLKYGNADGENQEKEGAITARRMLEPLGYDAAVIDRVCYLIAHHHTYGAIDGLDYQILVEADFLVNLSGASQEARNDSSKHFRTNTGIYFLHAIYA